MNRKAMLGLLCFSVVAMQLFAADGVPASPEASGGSGASGSTNNVNAPAISGKDIDAMRKQIAEQEKEIEKLQKAVSAQREMLETTMRAVSTGGVSTSAAPMLVNASGSGVLQPVAPANRVTQDAASAENTAPLSLKIGDS